MLETVDLNAEMKKSEYKSLMAELDLRLAHLQRELRAAKVPVLIVFEGWDCAGKGSTLGRLLQPLDPRGYKVHHVLPPNKQELLWPAMCRFWQLTPANGQLAIYNHSWYRQALGATTMNDLPPHEQQEAYGRIRVFERQLADDGAVIVKFFLHISKKEQAKRFKKLSKDSAYAWKVGKAEKKQHKHYDDYADAVEDVLRETSTPYGPWTLVAATDERHRNVKVAETLVAFMEKALQRGPQPADQAPPSAPRRTSPLDQADPSLTIDKSDYTKELPRLQKELRRLQHLCYIQRRPVVMVYEGWDAGGKGGNIRRVVRELDPRGYEVIPIGAPQGEEREHHHLWRFWRALPKAGHFTIFDRSWYGRVMVERIEGFATPEEWSRAYREINEFEHNLADYGTVIFKFWLHISKEEQLARFEARQNTPHKRWKITDEDWRNREKWNEYWHAVSSMIERTSTVQAPWTIIEGNDKRYARIKTLKVLNTRLKKELE